MAKCKSLIYLILLTLLSCFSAKAFFIPDIQALGKDPEIYFFEPDYLISGSKVKIYGRNFFTSPKSANKLRINNKKVRVVFASDEYIEFIVPKLPLGEARIKLFTDYLGYKSKEVLYPLDGSSSLVITYPPPILNSVSSYSVKPNDTIFLFGEFNSKKDLFCKIQDKEVHADILDLTTSQIKLPDSLPVGLFKIKGFYKKPIFNSPFSNELILYNNEFGPPAFLKISLAQNTFTSIDDQKIPFKVELIFNNGAKTDVTDYSSVSVSSDEVLGLDKTNFKIKNKGEAEIKAEFSWLPENIMYTDSAKIIIDVPEAPHFLEVVIDEVFPFVSGLFPQTDANMDGFAKLNDEFIELQNLTEKMFDLSMCEIFIGEKNESQVLFPENTFIDPFSYFVVYGDDAKEGKLNLSNSGSSIELICDGITVDYVAYPSGKNGDSSWQRKPNLVGFEKHPDKMFSPGTAPPVVATMIVAEPSVQNPPLNIDSTNTTEEKPIDSSNDLQEESIDSIKEIKVTPNNLNIINKAPVSLKVEAIYESGSIVDVTTSSIYKVANESIATVDSNGVITPISNGATKLEIQYDELQLSIDITVNIPSEVQENELIINEILAAPSLDVNGDGVFQSSDDEFIEIVNVSGKELDISGLIISDKTKIRHTIPSGTILQNLEPLVIFGGGNIALFNLNVKTQLANTGSFGLNNTGDEEVILSTSDGKIINKAIFSSSGLNGISLNRAEDLKFLDLISHKEVLDSTSNYSPGAKANGVLFMLN